MNKQALVERHIEEGVAQGRWKVLEKIPPERELALQLCVSRGTVRSALQALCGKGLLESIQGSGTRVRHIPKEMACPTTSVESARQSIEAFALTMPTVVGHCVTKAMPSHVLKAERLLSTIGLAIRSSDAKAFATAQHDFFIHMLKAADNTHLLDIGLRLIPDKKGMLSILQQRPLQECEPLFVLFARMLSALRHADADAAVQATQAYTHILLHMLKETAACKTR